MSLRLEKQSLCVETTVGENTAQSVVEGSVTVPGTQPEIGRALRVKAQPNITGYDVVEGRIALEGNLDVDLLYASFTEVESAGDEGDEEPELILEERLEKAAFSGAIPFVFVLDVGGAEPGMLAHVDVSVESISFEVQEDQRTVDVDAVLEFSGVVKKTEELALTTRAVASNDVNIGQKNIRLKSASVSGRGQVHVAGVLPFGGRVLPEHVLELALQPASTPVVKMADGSAEVSGTLDCALVYSAQEVGAAKAEWTEAIPFEAQVLLPGCSAQAKTDAEVMVTDIHWHVVDSGEARGIEVDATVLVNVRAATAHTVSVVTSLTAEGPVSVAARIEPITVQEAVGEGALICSADASLELPSGSTPIERVLLSEAKARVEDVHVLGDKVAIEGVVSLSLVYVGRSGDTTSLAATAWPAAIPFDCELPIPGAEPGLERRVKANVCGVQVDLINRETVDVNVQLATKVALSRSVELEAVVEAVEVQAPDENPPTFTFVVLQEGDTLWQIAQRYHTDVSAILLANKWVEDDKAALPTGAKLCIPRWRGVA